MVPKAVSHDCVAFSGYPGYLCLCFWETKSQLSLTGAGIAPVYEYSFGFLYMVDYSISSLRTFYICRDHRFVTIPESIKNLITNCVIKRLMFILFSFQSRNFIKLNKSKRKLFRCQISDDICRLLFFFNKLLLEKKFIRKVERLNGKQRRSRWDGSYEPSHLDLRCLQKPIIIACGSES